MSSILDRYAGAVRSGNLRNSSNIAVDQDTYSDTDVLGAVGLAAKREPLAMALARLFCGDNHAAEQIVVILASMAWGKAAALRTPLKRTQAVDMARAVLAWHRDGVCKACNGHGFDLIAGAPAISGHECSACRGSGKILFERQFAPPLRYLATWLLAEVEREQGRAGPAALAKLADRLAL